jgi:peptidoglycan-associated lipoprotein
MKNIVLSSAVVALLVFTGCADKKPAVDENGSENQTKVEEVQAVDTESVSPDNTSVVGDGSSSMATLEKSLESVYFNFDKFSIRSDMQDNISADTKVINDKASNYSVKLEGNCDEWGSDEYNFALGLKRAQSVKKAIIAEGVDASRITMVSYGESNPVCSDKTQECWSKNRRVDYYLLPCLHL